MRVKYSSLTGSQQHVKQKQPRMSPLGRGGLTVRLVHCSEPSGAALPHSMDRHRHPKSTLRKDHSHLRALPPAPKGAASQTGWLIPAGSPAGGHPLPGAPTGGAKLPAARREPPLTHDVYSFIWCWLLWEPLAWPLQKQS